jgi:hypothetical protein
MEFVVRVLFEQVSPLERSKLDQIVRNQERIETILMALTDQLTQLQAAVASVKQASDDEAVRVDAIIASLQTLANDNPVVASAITDLQATADKLRAFHAEQPAPPAQPQA